MLRSSGWVNSSERLATISSLLRPIIWQKASLTSRTLSSRSRRIVPAMLCSNARRKRCSLFANASAAIASAAMRTRSAAPWVRYGLITAGPSRSLTSSPCMSAASARPCLEDCGDSDQYQDDASSEQVVAPMVLVGVGDIAKEWDRPANPVDVVPLYRQGPRVPDHVRIALGVEL